MSSWGEALETFADWLSLMEAQLDADAWDAPLAAPDLPALSSAPTELQLALAVELQERTAACQQRLRAKLEAKAGELQALQQRRNAARSYSQMA